MNRLFQYISIFFAVFLFACGEKIHEFSGFSKVQLEYLLAGDSANVWERTGRWEDGIEVQFTGCQENNRMIFMAAGKGGIQRLLYSYDTGICDSLGFCDEYQAYCLSDTTQCSADPNFCATLEPGTLYVATWKVTGVTEDYEITDQLRISFPGFSYLTQITQVSSQWLEWEYQESLRGIGEPVQIKETYQRIE